MVGFEDQHSLDYRCKQFTQHYRFNLESPMNNICKVVWSHVHQQFVVVSEMAACMGKGKSIRATVRSASTDSGDACHVGRLKSLAVAVACAVMWPLASAQSVGALPTGC
jgi:hypothetical protein